MYAFGMPGSEWSRAIAVAAFVGSYAALGLGKVPGFRVDRTGVAIIGAAVMVVSGVIGWDEAVASVDAARAANLRRPWVLTAVTAMLSNLVSNVPALLLLKPLVPVLGDDPERTWLILAMASTLAGNLTILGSVANLIVVEAARTARVEIGFVEYCKVGVPLTLVTLFLGWLLLVVLPG